LWEIAIKINLGKLTIKFPFVRFASYLADNEIEVLQIGFDHLIQVATLDLHHRDPFDRIIIAQGVVENLTIITNDENFPNYTDKTLWK
jgi:PIN domain nuclease of toxin-antitoxin system